MEVVPIARPAIGESEIAAVVQVLRSGQLAAGAVVHQFESAFATVCGASHAIATSSGTTALQVALRALRLEPGTRVITTPFSFIATANAIVDAGLVPLFVDIDPDTFNLSPTAVAAALAKHDRVGAILAVHLYGLPFDRQLIDLAQQHGVWLVEDAAQAHGATLDGRPVGSLGHIAAFSFYPTKNMTTGEGGMVTTSDAGLADRVRLLINHGQRARYHHESLGFNYRMTEMQAAIGLPQLRALPERNARRRALAAYYDRVLPATVVRPTAPAGHGHVYHQYTLRTADRDAVVASLTASRIGTMIYYPRLIPDQPSFAGLEHICEPCPVAARTVDEVVSIPVHPSVTDAQAERVAVAVRTAVAAITACAAGAGEGASHNEQ